MADFIRRVVTGHDKNGKAIVISDGPAPAVKITPLRPGHKSTDVWKTKGDPIVLTHDEADPTGGPRHMPAPQETLLRISEIAPEPEAFRTITPDQAKQFFASAGHESSSTFARNKRHPFMHRTETFDYAVVLEGEITMLLDEDEVQLKAGDVVIQRGTNHAWSNRSGKPVRMLYVLMGAKFDPALSADVKRYEAGSGSPA
jgi:quercetin dioxygenase-like cupin family protein